MMRTIDLNLIKGSIIRKMSYLISNIPHFKCWVRKEFTCNHEDYHGEYLHALAIAVNTIPDRCLSFQVVFTGCEVDGEPEDTIHGGAMWARMPITALVADIPLEEEHHMREKQVDKPRDCSARKHSVISMERGSSSTWICRIAGEDCEGKYIFHEG